MSTPGCDAQWAVFDNGFGEQHIVPLEDLRVHALTELCWCSPARDKEYDEIVIHNAADEREQYERGERKPS